MTEVVASASKAVIEPAAEKRFVKEMAVGKAMALHPGARWVFSSYQLSGCSHCSSSSKETLEQVAEGYGIPLDNLIDDLNSLLAG